MGADNVGNHFFVRGRHAKLPPAPVGKTQQFRAVFFPPPRFFP